MSNIVETIKTDLTDAIENDKLVLPTLPEVALQVRDIAENEDSAIIDLVKVISNDTALSARIIRVCNSPLFRGSRAIENLNMAVVAWAWLIPATWRWVLPWSRCSRPLRT